jgi:opacity protein-like surface antigen
MNMLQKCRKAILCISLLYLQAPLHAHVDYEGKVRGAAFIPTNELFRDLYGSAAGNFDAEFGARVHEYVQIWVNVDYTQAHGHSLVDCKPSTITIKIINGSFGLKVPYDVTQWCTMYLGLGPTFGSIHTKDEPACPSDCSFCPESYINEPVCRSSCSQSSVGIVAKSGIDFFFHEHGFIDLFADYIYQTTDFLNASGVRIGVGIGFKF